MSYAVTSMGVLALDSRAPALTGREDRRLNNELQWARRLHPELKSPQGGRRAVWKGLG